MQTKMIDPKLLTSEERNWINSYHAEVQAKLEPLLKEDKRALSYLARECMPI
jgi:Xaa-Pro aminopeptidase